MGQVKASSLKEIGDWAYAEDATRWHSPERLLKSYKLHDMTLCVTQVRSQCQEILSCPVVVSINSVLYAWGSPSEVLCIHESIVDKALSQKGLR